VGASLFFSVAHYALRPWPWIIVALVSVLVYPELSDKEAGYPMLMKDILPSGWFGLLLVVFLSAFVSTVSTHVNWGASYVINDVYRPFLKPETSFSSPEAANQHYVFISRLATMLMILVAIVISYFFDSVKGGWQAILSLGAGVGPVYILRWLWWRINAWSEISAMLAAAVGSLALYVAGIDDFATVLLSNTIFSSIVWVLITYLTQPEPKETLESFAERVKPPGPGWASFAENKVPLFPDLLKAFGGVAGIILTMFGMHTWFFTSAALGVFLLGLGILLLIFVTRSIAEEAF
jgi:Na+/proline symporter